MNIIEANVNSLQNVASIRFPTDYRGDVEKFTGTVPKLIAITFSQKGNKITYDINFGNVELTFQRVISTNIVNFIGVSNDFLLGSNNFNQPSVDPNSNLSKLLVVVNEETGFFFKNDEYYISAGKIGDILAVNIRIERSKSQVSLNRSIFN